MQEKRQITYLRKFISGFIFISVGIISLLSVNAYAQLSPLRIPGEVEVGSRANIFVDWEGETYLQGLVLDVEGSSAVEEAVFTCQTKAPALTTETTGARRQQVTVTAAEVIRGKCNIVITVRTGSSAGLHSFKLQPVVPPRVQRKNDTTQIVQGTMSSRVVLYDSANLVGNFGGRFSRPISMGSDREIDIQTPFTIELWIRTTDVDNVVFSTWDGSEQNAYPAEIVIEPAGRPVFYTGEPGLHESMASQQPIADGQWHHLAITNDPAKRLMTMMVDGNRVDSLRLTQNLSVRTGAVALGGRTGSETSDHGLFKGQMDEVRVWSIVRSIDEVEQARYRSSIESQDVVISEGFESSDKAEGIDLVSSTLTFSRPIEDIQVKAEGRDVSLSWTGATVDVQEFVVEESSDGITFSEAEIIPVDGNGSVQQFRHTSYDVKGGVAYFRIRQQFNDSSSRTSRVLKVGLGESLLIPEVHLTNFPNPFSLTTRISYEVPDQSPVRLTVWDVAGQAVAVLVNEVQPAGRHEAEFNASDLPSGIYFVRLEMGELVQSRKITVAK